MSSSQIDDQNDQNKLQVNSDETEFQKNIDKPFIPKPYYSQTMLETDNEITSQQVPKRPLIKMKFGKQRKMFNGNYKFNDTDAVDKKKEILSQQDPMFHQWRRVLEIGIQGRNETKISCTQTNWNKKINRIFEPIQNIQENEIKIDEDELGFFLYNVYPIMEQALQSNETIDIFQDDFNVLPQEEFNKNESEISNTLKEIKSFQSLKCKGKKVNCIQFQPSNNQPKSKYIVAQSFIENLNFDDRAILSGKSYNNYILFWDFETIHSIDPVLQLQSPIEIYTFEFNPKDNNILVAGTLNGQILLYDLKSFNTKYFTKKNNKSKLEVDLNQKITPLTMSALQDPSGQSGQGNEIFKKQVNSHKNPVLCIKWLPSTIEFDRKYLYNLNFPQNQDLIHQFVSISEDGQLLFWDTRIGEKLDNRQSQIKQTQQIDITTIPWRANYGIQLFRPEGGGQMGGSFVQFYKNQKHSQLVGTTDEGELFVLDWTQKQTDENPKLDYVQKLWQQQKNMRSVIGLERSPFYEDIVLTLHDYYFVVWRLDINEPIFESIMLKNCQISCGCFSPTRPGLIFIGRTDGRLDIWDFTDQSHQETMNHQISSSGISSIKFHNNPQSLNILAVGDYDGTLHLLELPQMLHKKQNNEESSMNQFWDREVKRVHYFQQRFELRESVYRQNQMNQHHSQGQEDKDKVDHEDQDDLDIPTEEEMEAKYQQFLLEYEVNINPDKKPELINNDKKKK